jgi:AraC-like DNA-binding protein
MRAIVFPESTLEDLFRETGIHPSEVIFDDVEFQKSADLAESIENIFTLRRNECSLRIAFECHAVSLLLDLASRYSSNLSPWIRRHASSGFFPSNIARAQKVIAENIRRADFTLDDLASQAGISKFHLIRSFKKSLGVSPMRYIRLVRLEHAKSLLARGDSVALASERSGFKDCSTVNKVFKRHLGRPPSAYKSS